jgi:hypothetical protein
MTSEEQRQRADHNYKLDPPRVPNRISFADRDDAMACSDPNATALWHSPDGRRIDAWRADDMLGTITLHGPTTLGHTCTVHPSSYDYREIFPFTTLDSALTWLESHT